jgi:uncharacterized protein (TIGR02301 family)
MRAAIAGALFLALVCAAASAQQAPAKGASTEPAAPIEAPPPYEPQLLRLAELMGALAYLRELCGDSDANIYHDKMSALLDAEAKSQSRKEILAGAYNRSFRDYRTAYRKCTPAARDVIAGFLAATSRISTDIANRYGG